jgi:uncharacterized protein (TIGR00730 family)
VPKRKATLNRNSAGTRQRRTVTMSDGSAASLLGDLNRDHSRPLISVFGSSQALPGSRLFASSRKMGQLLGAAGFDLMTGGYEGVMQAASEGAHEAGAHVIGVTMDRFKSQVNSHVMEEIRTADFYERFAWLVDRADGYIAMHGGIGTLAEVTFTWQEILLGMVPARPLILVGERWQKLFVSFRQNLIRTPRLFDQMKLVATPEAALKLMLQQIRPPLNSASNRVRDQP